MRRLLLLSAACCAAGAAGAQPSLTLGELTHGTLSYDDPRLSDGTHYDEYSFVARRGESIVVSLGSDQFDTFLYVGFRDFNGFREIQTDDDGGGGTNSRVGFVAPQDGVYLVRANSLTPQTGAYFLTVQGSGQAAAASTGSKQVTGSYGAPVARDGFIRSGQYVDGLLTTSDPRLDGGEPFHLYRYSGRRGERVLITLRSSEFDAYLVLGTAGGRHGVQSALARDDDGAGGNDSRIAFTLPYDGEYVIRVNPIVGGSGRYRLTVEGGY